VARRTSTKKPVLPKSEKEQIRRVHEQRPMRGKRKTKFKTRQIDVVEWLPSGRKKPQRRVWRTFPREKCVSGVSPVCRFCSVGQPLELFQGKGKAKLVDSSIVEGWAVITPDKKTAMQVRRTGRGYEYFLARFPSEQQAREHARNLAYACEQGLALAEGREAHRPPTETEYAWEQQQQANEDQIKQLMYELPSELLQDIGLLPMGITPEKLADLRETGAVLPGAGRKIPKLKQKKTPREVIDRKTREWEPWLGEEEAEIIHQESYNRALQRLREKRRWSVRHSAKTPLRGYADVFTLSSGPIKWGGSGSHPS
jgi:hypothetical protein